ncbi:MAG: hypothetical protein ACR2N6_03670 [Miltoncostaeaceae bacterium]
MAPRPAVQGALYLARTLGPGRFGRAGDRDDREGRGERRAREAARG